ncbi:hypothetical protein B0T24DRAFT_594593 [Lasiosphaeria ovina]|uniref:Uncharacterized protein n=1 Tax=Lasiosphaeria ovina TaxID=92902 RepID=A0AAE0KDC8_9PEZI|nr:hypothetical protein B0T24DRAFT_594593 [Lasiosphaeria ovina]
MVDGDGSLPNTLKKVSSDIPETPKLSLFTKQPTKETTTPPKNSLFSPKKIVTISSDIEEIPATPRKKLFTPRTKRTVVIVDSDIEENKYIKKTRVDREKDDEIEQLKSEVDELREGAGQAEEERRQLFKKFQAMKDEPSKNADDIKKLKTSIDGLTKRANALSASLTNVVLLGKTNAMDAQQLVHEISLAIERGKTDDYGYRGEYETNLARYDWVLPEEETGGLIPYKVDNDQDGADEAIVRDNKLFIVPTKGPLAGREVFIGNMNEIPEDDAQLLGLTKDNGNWTKK